MTTIKSTCPRCEGRKYEIVQGAAYQRVLYGGRKIECRECGGNGYVLSHDTGGFVDVT